MISALLGLLFCSPAEIDSLAAFHPPKRRQLTHGEAVEHCGAAKLAAFVSDQPRELLNAIAAHESDWREDAVTPEPGNRVSCGVMTPDPKRACDWIDRTLVGGYVRGALHLAVWRRKYSPTAALWAYAGGGGTVALCAAGDDSRACEFAPLMIGWARTIAPKRAV
jgi:formylglycine-generating enzyme required for sulfatase activity